MKRLMKSIFKISILLVSIAILAGCSDWTSPESIEIEKNSIQESNPELYSKYCAALREYKNSDHRITYTTFENVAGIAANGSQKISMLPDSIDFVQLMNLEVSDTHLKEIAEARNNFGTRFVMRFSYEDCLAAYEAYVEEAENEAAEGEETAPELTPFEDFYKAEFKKVADKVTDYSLDGLTFANRGKNVAGMTAEQMEEYLADQALVLAPVKDWCSANGSKLFFYEGQAEYCTDEEFVKTVKYFILPTRSARSVGELGLYGINSYTSGKLPENAKLLYAIETPSFIEEEYLVGQFVLGEQIPLTADWIVKDASFAKSGVAIWNVQRDYFNTGGLVYPNVRAAIKTMNPNE